MNAERNQLDPAYYRAGSLGWPCWGSGPRKGDSVLAQARIRSADGRQWRVHGLGGGAVNVPRRGLGPMPSNARAGARLATGPRRSVLPGQESGMSSRARDGPGRSIRAARAMVVPPAVLGQGMTTKSEGPSG